MIKVHPLFIFRILSVISLLILRPLKETLNQPPKENIEEEELQEVNQDIDIANENQ